MAAPATVNNTYRPGPDQSYGPGKTLGNPGRPGYCVVWLVGAKIG
jgi:hypothetical protein